MIRKAQVVLWLAAVVVGVLAASSAGQGPPGGAPPGLDKAIAAMEKHADKWLDKQNVVGVGIGENKAGKAVIHVYKLTDDDEGIPSDVDGVAVEHVHSGRFDPRALPTDRWPRPVPIGVSSGLADFATGTLGARVTDGTNVYALSNNHVFAGVNTASVGDAITQPGVEDGGSDPADRIATLADYQAIDFNGGNNIMDAAIAVTSAGNVATATPPDGYGAPSTTPTAAAIGMGVQKYGRTTGFQLGAVQDVNFSVDVCYFALGEFCFPGYEARFVNQISVSGASFSAPGDSGSLIVTQGGNQPVALLFAGDGQLTIGNPIIPVLQRFGVTIDGAPPGDGPPGAPTALNAVAGDAQVALNWNAPAFDGGSQISEYKVYRGTSSGGESLLPTSTITSTSYTDTTAANGTTYYYKVAAVNGSGVGPTSNEASATPVAVVAPSSPLAIVDNFNRANESPLSDAGRWTNSVIPGESGHHVTSNQLACSVTTTCTAWRNAQYGPDVEVYARVPTLPGDNNGIRLYARLQQPAHTGYMLRTLHTSGADEVWLERFAGGATRLLTIVQELAAGDTLLLRVQGASIEAWRHDGSSWSRLGVVQDATYGAPGFAGVGLRGTTGRLDDFGARTIGASSPPGAPTALNAVAGDAQVALNWNAPAFDGGSQISEYKVYRGTSSGGESLLPTSTITSTSYTDTTAANGTTYYYKVAAVNGSGVGPTSNEASATPVAVVAPSSPLAIVDNFNRANESPLSDAGRWTNSVIPGESGHHVTSNQLACSVTTTCTAWRNAQYGPDVEVYARVPTLPGDNNGIRLYARLQQPAHTGYMLRTLHTSGADEVWLERFAGGATRLLTIVQELAAGDTLLLRVQGASIEAWRHDGSSWSRLGVVQDATYSAAGYAGVGLRGTTGRLDDYGARSLGGPSPTAPSAPQSLQASAGNAQVVLAWSAPSFDGGSPLTSYTLYRGTSPNPTGVHASGVSGTSYTDLSAANGTTYYYRVSASNAVGEGPLSNEVSATPTAPPTAPSAPQSLQASAGNAQVVLAWSAPSFDGGSPLTSYTLYRGTSPNPTGVHASGVSGTSYTDLSAANGTTYYYRVSASNAVGEGPLSNEVSATPTAPPTAPSAPQSLQASAGNAQVVLAWSAPSFDGGSPLTSYTLYRGTSPNPTGVHASGVSGTSYTDLSAANGTTYYYRVSASNAVGEGPLSNEVSATPTAPPTAPSAPQSLQASAGNAQVVLAWSAPSFDGGSPLTSYTLYRGTSPNPTGVHASGVSGTSYTDLSAANGTTYYYRVSASNAVGEGPLSNEVSATPTDLVVPVEPLPILDTFNRASENPLSFGGRWGNGILGASERSLRVISNQLSSDRNTTTTAWWNQAQFSPSCEAYATMSTRPGNGNAIRLYVRLQSPGSGAVDGYMLLYTQASGTDSVAILRMTNGSGTQLAVAGREVPAGAGLLLRANGTALEAWVREGTTWSRVIRTSDSTYTAAGRVGVGIRGKTGRLDDFGAR